MPRWRLVFSGWQYPMLPSRAVNIFIYFKVKKTRAKLVAKAITGLLYTWIDSLISWESSCYVVHFFVQQLFRNSLQFSSSLYTGFTGRTSNPRKAPYRNEMNCAYCSELYMSKLLFNNAIGICVALKILEVKDLQFWSFESLIT